jgi:hypothetical protein
MVKCIFVICALALTSMAFCLSGGYAAKLTADMERQPKLEALSLAVDFCYARDCHPIAVATIFEAYLNGELDPKIVEPETEEEKTKI